MKKTCFFISILLFFSILNITAQNKEPKYLFKIASELPDGSTWVESMKKIGNELYKKSNGLIGIRVYPGGIMGDQATIIKKIKIGQLSGATFSGNGLSRIYKDSAIMGFPMIFKDYKEYDYIKQKTAAFFDKEFEKRGYVVLSWSEVGFIYVYSKNKVYSVETLRKSKPFVVKDDEISLALFKEVNTNPVPVQISDIVTALQTGTIDTVFASPSTLIIMQWFTKVKYMANFPVTLMIGAILVDKDLFYSMPAQYQQEMKRMFRTTFDGINQKVRKDNDEALELLKKNGSITVLQVAKKDTDLFNTVCNNVANDLTKSDYSRELYNTIKGYLKEYREKNNK